MKHLWRVLDPEWGDWYVLAENAGVAYRKVRAAQIKRAKKYWDEKRDGPLAQPDEPNEIIHIARSEQFVK